MPFISTPSLLSAGLLSKPDTLSPTRQVATSELMISSSFFTLTQEHCPFL